jgi:hypothetical protein
MLIGEVLVIAMTMSISACATRTSSVAASTHSRASLYRSSTAYVQQSPDRAFNPAVNILLERTDIEITNLEEADNRCTAKAGDRKLTLRVIEADRNRSRLSLLVGGGDDPAANQELAERLMRDICAHFGAACELGANGQ